MSVTARSICYPTWIQIKQHLLYWGIRQAASIRWQSWRTPSRSFALLAAKLTNGMFMTGWWFLVFKRQFLHICVQVRHACIGRQRVLARGVTTSSHCHGDAVVAVCLARRRKHLLISGRELSGRRRHVNVGRAEPRSRLVAARRCGTADRRKEELRVGELLFL